MTDWNALVQSIDKTLLNSDDLAWHRERAPRDASKVVLTAYIPVDQEQAFFQGEGLKHGCNFIRISPKWQAAENCKKVTEP